MTWFWKQKAKPECIRPEYIQMPFDTFECIKKMQLKDMNTDTFSYADLFSYIFLLKEKIVELENKVNSIDNRSETNEY